MVVAVVDVTTFTFRSADGQEFCQEMKEALEKLVGVAGLKAQFVCLESDGIPYVTLEEQKGDEVFGWIINFI